MKKSEASAGVRRSSDANAAAASKDQAATAAAHTEAPAGTEDRKEEEDEELLALIRERKAIKKEDKERIREVSKKIKKCIRDKKRSERLGKSKKILKSSKGQKNANIKSAKRRILIPKIKNMTGEVITSRKGIADVFGEFYGKLYDDDCDDKMRTEAESNEKKKVTEHKLQEMNA